MLQMGVLCASDIAKRRLIPALQKSSHFALSAVGLADDEERSAVLATESRTTEEKKQAHAAYCKEIGAKPYTSYAALLADPKIDAVYVSLPPALHAYWSRQVLLAGKHLLVEKPIAVEDGDAEELLGLAAEKELAVVENYGFLKHQQMSVIRDLLRDEIGELRLVRAAFGFPRRREDDFRYERRLGGGALLDCGGYTLRFAEDLLGPSMRILAATSAPLSGHDVDGQGAILARNDQGVTAQLSFGMDNQYKCEAELWGSAGSIYTGRIFTAPPEYPPVIRLTKGTETREITAEPDDQFLTITEQLYRCICEASAREAEYEEIRFHNRCLLIAARLSTESEQKGSQS